MDFAKLIQEIVVVVPGFLIGITVHEYAHGYVAYRLGDPTAKLAGRLSFNPIHHLDAIGTLVLVLTRIIGWAKPVPVDPRYLRDPRRDMLWISLAGPGANMVAAIVFAIALHAMVFMLQGPPSGPVALPAFIMFQYAVLINVAMAIFNMLPVPPLDGSKILMGVLPSGLAYQFQQIEQYGFIIIVLLIVTNAVEYIVYPPIKFVLALLMSGLG